VEILARWGEEGGRTLEVRLEIGSECKRLLTFAILDLILLKTTKPEVGRAARRQRNGP
jgi:hypothetical protein